MTIRIINAHVLDGLAMLPAESVHCVVTSPPYYGLRDYGIEPQVWGRVRHVCATCAGLAASAPIYPQCPDCRDGFCECEHEWGDDLRSAQRNRNGAGASGLTAAGKGKDFIALYPSQGAFCRQCNAWRGSLGLEPTLDLYLDHMVEVFRAVRRVLRKDGTCWLNIGDSYSTTQSSRLGGKRGERGSDDRTFREIGMNTVGTHSALKPKDLMLIPSRLAIRLQEDGWWVRSDIAWCKKAPMPESCTDRPTTAWEHVFLLTKSAKYFYDAEAVKEESETDPTENYPGRAKITGRGTQGFAEARGNDRDKSGGFPINGGKRNMRNFWLLGPSPYPEAHFATFPPEVPRRAILAGTSERGVCPKCGAPWMRITKSRLVKSPMHGEGSVIGRHYETGANGWDGAGYPRRNKETETIGWRSTCLCYGASAYGCNPVPATVLDPFLGAGTTGLVADQLQRNCVGIELSSKYAEMARLRILEDNSLFLEIAAE